MTYQELFQILQSTELPVTYYEWKEEDYIPPLPYLVFYFPSSDNFGADNIVYKNIEQLNVELYSKNKDFALEKRVEKVLNDNRLFWQKQESFIEDENMYEVLYISEIVINDE